MKKTVITTEKREVWIIRQPSGEMKENEVDGNEAERSANSLITLLNQDVETEESASEED
jgi:hypothetical protein